MTLQPEQPDFGGIVHVLTCRRQSAWPDDIHGLLHICRRVLHIGEVVSGRIPPLLQRSRTGRGRSRRTGVLFALGRENAGRSPGKRQRRDNPGSGDEPLCPVFRCPSPRHGLRRGRYVTLPVRLPPIGVCGSGGIPGHRHRPSSVRAASRSVSAAAYRSSAPIPSAGASWRVAGTNAAPTAIAANGNASSARATR